MAKSNNREIVIIGASQPSPVLLEQLQAARRAQPVLQLDREHKPGEGPNPEAQTQLDAIGREITAALARDDERRCAELFGGDAGPGSIVGLAQLAPGGDTGEQ